MASTQANGKRARRSFTDEQKRELVAKINADIASGMFIADACKKHDIVTTRYQAWKAGKSFKAKPLKKDGTLTTFDVAALPKKPKKIKTYNKPHQFTERQRAKIMARIEAKMKRGMNAHEASLACGVNQSSYYLWKKKPSLLAPAVYVNGQANGHAKSNGHDANALQITLQVSAISLSVAGQPVAITLQDAIRLQQGLDKLLAHR